MQAFRRATADYRVPISASILVAALASMFVLSSQSASSVSTYLLGLYVLFNARRWRGLFLDWGFLAILALLGYLAASGLWSTPWDGPGAVSKAIRVTLVVAFVIAVAEGMQVDWFRRRMTFVLAVVAGGAAFVAIAYFLVEVPKDGRLNGLGQLDTHVAAGMVYAVGALCGLAWLLDAHFVTDATERRTFGRGEQSGTLYYNGQMDKAGLGQAARGEATVVKAVTIAAVATLATAVVMTGSRNAIACGIFGALSLALAFRCRGPGAYCAWLVTVGAVAATILGLACFLVPGVADLILPRGDSHRLAIWSHYFERAWANGLWFGHGLLTDDRTVVNGFAMLHPHNLFLAVLWQGGLVALALLVVVIVTTLLTLLRRFDDSESKLALSIWALALPGYLMDGHELIDKIGWTWLLFWLPVAIGVGQRARKALRDARRFGRYAEQTV